MSPPAPRGGPSLVVVGDLALTWRLLLVDGPLPGQGARAEFATREIGGHAGVAAALLAAAHLGSQADVREGAGATPALTRSTGGPVTGSTTAVRLAAAVGDDDAGRLLVDALARLGVDTSAVLADHRRATGLVVDAVVHEADRAAPEFEVGADGEGASGAPARAVPGGPPGELERPEPRERRPDGTTAGGPIVLPAAVLDGWGEGPDPAREAALFALAATRPGDALLLDGGALGRLPDVVEAAWEADVQVVADLSALPWPGGGRHGDLRALGRVDVAVVEPRVAARLADVADAAPASVLLVTDDRTSWDGEVTPAPPVVAGRAAAAEGSARDPLAEHDDRVAAARRHAAFAAGLAAALADGADRDEALRAAWAVRAAVPAGRRVPALLLDGP
ncbi:hypothetical protein [Agilicoccus flavus]|uniref:hypothetical protein n=1 Tax=Agilicoccus flavus TaxID=2775968 RepID=UPI001CF61397|nr:hypothetical protein [Agilicoccus flavus]